MVGAYHLTRIETCTGSVEDVHGYEVGWVGCRACAYLWFGLTVWCLEVALECPRCHEMAGGYVEYRG